MNFDMNMSPGNDGMMPPFGDGDLIPINSNLKDLSVGIDDMRVSIIAFQSGQMGNNFFNGYQQQQLNDLIMTLGNLLQEYGVIQDQLIGALKAWQRKQTLGRNGAPPPSNLDGIQLIVETLLDRITDIILFINNLLQMGNEAILNEYLQHAQALYHILIVSTFIVETQPPQVKKKGTKNMSATVRWLIGDKLGIHLSKPVVKCAILSEDLAKRLTVENIRMPPESSGTMTNNECEMIYDSNTRKFSATFSNLMISEAKRFERRGSENVTDKKHTLLFYTTAECKGHAINCWAISAPLIVIVHDNQGSNAWATILWDNAFSAIEREPFKVPERVHYIQISEALDMYFGLYTNRHLTPDNLNTIANKLRLNETGQLNDYISFSQFCKDKMPNCVFSFWEWFYDIKKLTTTYLKEAWAKGHIVGFISKREASEILSRQAHGTFLLRFSDSTKGGVSIAYRDYSEIIMLEPWTSADFLILSLTDRIRNLNCLKIVYPTMVASNAVFCTSPPRQTAKNGDGYVRTRIQVHANTPQPANDPQTSPQTQSGTTVSDNVHMQNGYSFSTEQSENSLDFCDASSPQTQSGTTVSDNVHMQNGYSFSTEQSENSFDFRDPQTINWPDWDNSGSAASGDYFSGISSLEFDQYRHIHIYN
ncbi:signal transducer and transcription activator isoform X2 [Zeugodacus cucurbitae]|nr:signal transducer and transcription activator isoform X2 [Zeugodacus cucurbitae]XP_054092046.1 signal transducer and transcription activator isoform X2 [Zeugodacus cucurbitae]